MWPFLLRCRNVHSRSQSRQSRRRFLPSPPHLLLALSLHHPLRCTEAPASRADVISSDVSPGVIPAQGRSRWRCGRAIPPWPFVLVAPAAGPGLRQSPSREDPALHFPETAVRSQTSVQEPPHPSFPLSWAPLTAHKCVSYLLCLSCIWGIPWQSEERSGRSAVGCFG